MRRLAASCRPGFSKTVFRRGTMTPRTPLDSPLNKETAMNAGWKSCEHGELQEYQNQIVMTDKAKAVWRNRDMHKESHSGACCNRGCKYKDRGALHMQTKGGVSLVMARANRSDLENILALQHAAYRSEAELLGDYDIPPLKQTLEDVQREFETSIILKATDERGEIIGSVRGTVADGSLRIGKLIVDPVIQGRGLGTVLLHAIEGACDCERYELFTSSKSVRNIGLYERAGYSIFKNEEIGGGLTLVYLQKIARRS